METYPSITIAYHSYAYKKPIKFQYQHQHLDRSSSYKGARQLKILLTLIEYLLIYSNKFEKAFIIFDGRPDNVNGTYSGRLRSLLLKEADIGAPMVRMTEESKVLYDFTYPFQFQSYRFITAKPEYTPHFWGIFQTISSPVWITVLFVLLAMILLSYKYFKTKYAIDKIILHLWAVFLRQNSIIQPTSLADKFLIFSWVIGTMFLCLAYDSVFLSFLSFPPVNKIKNLSELSKSISNGEYQCLCELDSAVLDYLTGSKVKFLQEIGAHILSNNLNNRNIKKYFFVESNMQNLAIILTADYVNVAETNLFLSEDTFFENAGAFLVRKDFCCKKLLETFVHRMMASGLYFKYLSENHYLNQLFLLSRTMKNETDKRKITLTDLAPAFMFLLTGHLVSILVFIAELLSKKKKKTTIHNKNQHEKNALF